MPDRRAPEYKEADQRSSLDRVNIVWARAGVRATMFVMSWDSD